MDSHQLKKLLQKYHQGKTTEVEYQFLLSYYNLFDANSNYQSPFSDKQKEDLEKKILKDIWSEIDFQEKGNKNIKPFYNVIIRNLAAAAVIIAICSICLFHLLPVEKQKSMIVHSAHRKENRLIRLPDGSTVIVSAGSKFNYSSSFDGQSKREVYLEGEAYFDIKHNFEKPFIVHTGKVETTVLGTAFNVKAWPNDTDIAVTVTRGKVKVGVKNKTFGLIIPNEQLIYNKEKELSVQNAVEASKYLEWKKQDLLLDDLTITEATELLEERFQVSITCNDDRICSQRFTTIFLKDESLEKILKSICEFNNAAYLYNKDNASIIITSKNNSN